MENSLISAVLAWFVPGAGHFMIGKWQRGLIIAAVVWTMFVVGMLSGGAYYPGYAFKDGALLVILNIFAKLGNGLGFLVGTLLSMSPQPNIAAWATFEYGGRFLEVAGLVNFLAVIDAADISLGRKE
jgi:hypothetical protein